MKDEGRFTELAMRYLDRQLTGAEMEELNAWLREDAEARAWLWEIAAQATAMGDLARTQTALQSKVAPLPQAMRWTSVVVRWAAAAAALTLLVCGLFWLAQAGSGPVATLTEVSGSVLWSGDKGATRTELAPGARLPAGTLETVGAVAAAQLRFADGTLLTLGANSEVAFAITGQKRIHLKSGTLTAAVTKQPAGHPMLVRTPTAEVEVLGTLFALSTQPEETRLDVASGLVRLRRLADGRAVDVTAQHSAVASLDAQLPLTADAPSQSPTHWSAAIAAPPAGGSKGEWRAAEGTVPARWHGVPLVMGRKKGGAPTIHHGVTARDSSRPSAGSFVTLTPESRVTVRWRTRRSHALFVFISTQRPGGAFGGNFEAKPSRTAATEDADGWRSLTIPIRAFRPLQANRTEFSGHGVSLLIVTTYDKDAGLEVAELVVDKPSS